ncbi:MAG TPA: asparagine synthase (glutamine-hydrolyzing) [Candidatus Paceibacterota bacterium]
MCGIAGITDTQIEEKEEAIQKMARAISHRGPDDDGFYIDRHVALGMKRLAIIDLKRGRQPITSTDGRFLIFFNGEIYNYKELKKELTTYNFTTNSDTEVILAGFLKWGTEVFLRLRGMFALAIYDTLEKRLAIARDPFGIKPLYYWERGNKIAAFSSEVKSFFALKSFKTEVNDAAVYNYLSYQYNPLEETFFKGVYKLPPAHFLTIDLVTGVFEIKRYWKFEFRPDENLTEETAKRKVLEVVKDSVLNHMIADVPVGSFLSGGVDSAIIATLMGQKIKTFTVTFADTKGRALVSEGRKARETAGPLGTEHTEIKVSKEEYFSALPKAIYHFDEPVADPSALGLYFLAQEARKSVKVVLSGEGADEFFGGYNIYLEPFSRKKIAWIPKFILKILSLLPLRGSNYAKRAISRLEDWYIGNASIFTPREILKIWKGEPMSRFNLGALYEEVKHLSDSEKMQYIDLNTWLIGDILAKADKMTMAHSLELRVPFLDREVAKLAEALPPKLKWKEGITKYILREAFKNILSESTRKRKKLGFPTPIAGWLDDEVFKEILSNEYINRKFDIKLIQNLFKNPKENARKIYLLLCLAIWYDEFIHKS